MITSRVFIISLPAVRDQVPWAENVIPSSIYDYTIAVVILESGTASMMVTKAGAGEEVLCL